VPYNNLTSRTDSGALVPEEVSQSMLGRVRRELSAAAQMFKRVPVARNQTRFPILSALPVAYWVNGDTGLKQTTEVAWSNKFLNIEEVAVIAPIPENVVDDLESAGVDVWSEIQPEVEEAIARTIDSAIFFGTNAPATFPTNISAAAAAAGNTFTEAATAAQGGIQDDIDAAINLVEDDGYDPTGIVAVRSLRGRLRRAREATTGARLDGVSPNLMEYLGLPIAYPMRGLFPAGGAAGTNVRAFVGDWTEFALGVRQDISFKLLDQAVIQDNTGAIVYNLAQQDMVAARFTIRVGWQVSNRINFDQPTEASRYPAARLVF
jgi:HK97 family phage major capsid protein